MRRELWWVSGRFEVRGSPPRLHPPRLIVGNGIASWIDRICCGPSGTEQQAENTQQQVSAGQLALGQQQQQLAQQQYNESQQLEAPLIAKETALASGNPSAVLSASMPEISQITQGFNASKAAIENQLPPGAARDQAIAQLNRQQYTGIAGVQASEVQQAPQILASVGAGAAGLSIQELAGALSGYSGANTSASGIAQEENQSQNNKLSFFSGLAGAAGNAAAGFGG